MTMKVVFGVALILAVVAVVAVVAVLVSGKTEDKVTTIPPVDEVTTIPPVTNNSTIPPVTNNSRPFKSPHVPTPAEVFMQTNNSCKTHASH